MRSNSEGESNRCERQKTGLIVDRILSGTESKLGRSIRIQIRTTRSPNRGKSRLPQRTTEKNCFREAEIDHAASYDPLSPRCLPQLASLSLFSYLLDAQFTGCVRHSRFWNPRRQHWNSAQATCKLSLVTSGLWSIHLIRCTTLRWQIRVHQSVSHYSLSARCPRLLPYLATRAHSFGILQIMCASGHRNIHLRRRVIPGYVLRSLTIRYW
jgi:hypothetical protein